MEGFLIRQYFEQQFAGSASFIMATRQKRLDEFLQGRPPLKQPVELLCEDHCGTYTLPFFCEWGDGAWRNAITGTAIDALVIGWRRPKR